MRPPPAVRRRPGGGFLPGRSRGREGPATGYFPLASEPDARSSQKAAPETDPTPILHRIDMIAFFTLTGSRDRAHPSASRRCPPNPTCKHGRGRTRRCPSNARLIARHCLVLPSSLAAATCARSAAAREGRRRHARRQDRSDPLRAAHWLAALSFRRTVFLRR